MTTFYNLANSAVSYLSVGISSGAGSLTITGGGSLFPSANFPVSIDSEIMLCSTRSSENFTISSRGIEGTTAASHDSGARVSLNVTKGIIQELQNFATAHEARAEDVIFIIDGGGSAIATGQKGHMYLDFGGTVQGWTLLADQSGSIQIDIWKDTYANFPPTSGDSMCGTAAGMRPYITTAVKNQDTVVTDWTTDDFASGDVLAFNVDSCTTITRASLILKVLRS